MNPVINVEYTYWQEPGGMYLGYLNIWPEHWTQGKDIAELEEMLQDLYEIYLEDQKENTIERKTGNLPLHLTTDFLHPRGECGGVIRQELSGALVGEGPPLI